MSTISSCVAILCFELIDELTPADPLEISDLEDDNEQAKKILKRDKSQHCNSD